MTRDIEALVKIKKEAYVSWRQLESRRYPEEYRGCRSTLKEMRRAKRAIR